MTETWIQLFYDKSYNGDNTYTNKNTTKIDIETFQDGEFQHIMGDEAIIFYNKTHDSPLKNYLVDDNILRINVFHRTQNKNTEIYTVIDVNCTKISNITDRDILNLIHILCKYHIMYHHANKFGCIDNMFTINRDVIMIIMIQNQYRNQIRLQRNFLFINGDL